ncbi:concanavalin A-like lectin/glucanase domain-containing protein [Crassisporium funariophilum]|nr:concanavalin A-like lectin/glucanase domain-containing protein [Crassisporium funariophilum]
MLFPTVALFLLAPAVAEAARCRGWRCYVRPTLSLTTTVSTINPSSTPTSSLIAIPTTSSTVKAPTSSSVRTSVVQVTPTSSRITSRISVSSTASASSTSVVATPSTSSTVRAPTSSSVSTSVVQVTPTSSLVTSRISVSSTAAASPTSVVAPPAATPTACKTYVVPGVAGGFTERVFTDFKGVKAGANAASFLSSNGYDVSNYGPINQGPISRSFVTGNVMLGDGTLDLKVNAYPGSGNTIGGEFVTKAEFKYASVRTVQKSSKVPGVVEGNFFYKSDNQETDWEILTATIDKSSDCVPKGIWVTNQALTSSGKATSKIIPFTFDPREDFHEYRIDWTARATEYYLDGIKVAEITANVPTSSGPWMWNVWSNGDPCWSGPAPTADSITQIQSIEIYKGYTSTVASGTDGICQI